MSVHLLSKLCTLQIDQMVSHKKKTSDQASACPWKENKEWKYQTKNMAGRIVCKF